MACIQGPLGACVATYHNVGDRRGTASCTRSGPSLFIAEKHWNRLIKSRNNWGEPRINTQSTRVVRVPARQPGDMACLESDLNHLSPLLPRCQLEAEWAGILMDEHARPGQLSLLLRSPAMVATWRAFGIPWVPATCTRVETWTSYRGQDCENKQGRSLDIIQRGRLREQTG
jgi:hypothetical protein